MRKRPAVPAAEGRRLWEVEPDLMGAVQGPNATNHLAGELHDFHWGTIDRLREAESEVSLLNDLINKPLHLPRSGFDLTNAFVERTQIPRFQISLAIRSRAPAC
jgi:hypothetical protein